ncbi:MAG: tetratricopeptide repeat protein [Candidatus Zixiibacteriota bacterium]|nr:MAG: tetratricopeptide repeat protein [candidate division Zixibacteria bacterium]
MFCHKCGTEILSSDASFCVNCREPLLKIQSPSDIEPQDPEPAETNQESCPSSVNLEFGDDDEALKMSDPIDFLMQESVEEESRQANPPNTGSTDKIETGNDEEVNMMIGGAGAGSSIDMDSDAKTQPRTAVSTIQQKPEEKEAPPPLSLPPQTDFNEGENIVATAKIKVNDANKVENRDLKPESGTTKLQNIKPLSDPGGLDIAKIKKSSRIAFLSGNSLTLSGGPKISVGDEITVGENSYEVRMRPKDKNSMYALIGSSILAIFITFYFLGAFNTSPYGGLVGMVMGPNDRPLSDQQVRIKETGDENITNNAGFFTFDDLRVGIYTVQYLIDDEVVGEQRITVLSDKISTIKLSENGLEPISSVETQPPKSRESPLTEKKTESSSVASSTAKKNEPGTVKLTLKPQGVRAYLDNRPMGVGSNSYRVRPGRYLLSVKKTGYRTQTKNITVKSGKTNSYSFTLKKESSRARKTDNEIAYEYEVAGNYVEAQQYYEKTLRRNPEDIRALLGKARCLKNQYMNENAVSFFVKAGKIAADKGDTESQYAALTGIIEMNPNNFTLYLNRGDVLYSKGDYSRAAEDYQKVITLDKRNLKAYYKLGNSYYKDSRYYDALEAYKGAEELHFADPKAQYYLAITYHALDDHKNTKKSYEKFKELASYSTAIEFKKEPEWEKVLEYLGVEN